MRKAGNFFKSIVPLIIAVLLQIVAMIPAEILYTIQKLNLEELNIDLILNTLLDSTKDPQLLQTTNIIYGLLALLVFIPWYRRVFIRPFKGRKRKQPGGFSFHTITSLIFLGFGLQYVCQLIVMGISQFNPEWIDMYNQLMETAGFSEPSLIIVAYTIILAPMAEEIIFRGLIFRYCRYALPFWIANIWQALLFGLLHMNPVQSIYAFALGLFLGFICHKGRGIKYSIVLHIIFNFFGSIANGLVDATLKINQNVFLGIGIALTIFALWLFSTDFRSAPKPKPNPDYDPYD